MNREELISQLQESFEQELPNIDSISNISLVDIDTNALVCFGKLSARGEELVNAAKYFQGAAMKLKSNPYELEKARFCELAAEALVSICQKKEKG